MKKNFGAIVFSMLMILSYGCGGSDGGDTLEPEDTKNPEMIISKPGEGANVMLGNDLLLSGTFSDDMELESLVVSLSFNETKAEKGIEDPWEPGNNPEIIVLTGVEDELINHKLFAEKIPIDCKSGIYILTLSLKDKSGKSTSKQINITIGG